ncbi:hypothetical protein L0B66_003145 [Salmonella enterica]|nr:hypothetical protein [Salmonella enterica]EIS6418997.1 hypothetical protein [Salmonella enterica]EIS6497569.1 hypothetical protein [Salmonella enterica]
MLVLQLKGSQIVLEGVLLYWVLGVAIIIALLIFIGFLSEPQSKVRRAGYAVGKINRVGTPEDEVKKLIFSCINNGGLSVGVWKKLYEIQDNVPKSKMKGTYVWAELLTRIGKIQSSIQTALESHTERKAYSHRDYVIENLADAKAEQKYRKILSLTDWEVIESLLIVRLSSLESQIKLNHALFLIKKAETLKTESSKKRYYSEIRLLLNEALELPNSNREKILSTMACIPS